MKGTAVKARTVFTCSLESCDPVISEIAIQLQTTNSNGHVSPAQLLLLALSSTEFQEAFESKGKVSSIPHQRAVESTRCPRLHLRLQAQVTADVWGRGITAHKDHKE